MNISKRKLIKFVAIAGIAGSLPGLLEIMIWMLRGTVTSAESAIVLLVYGCLGYGLFSMIFALLWYLITVRSQKISCQYMWVTAICIPIGLFVCMIAITLIKGALKEYVLFVTASISLSLMLCSLLHKFLKRLHFLSSIQAWLLFQAILLNANIILIAMLFKTGGWQWFGVPMALLAVGYFICVMLFKIFKSRVSLLALTNVIAIAVLTSIPLWLNYSKRVRSEQQLPNILLITIDTFRSDHIGCYGYESARTPNIDQMAEEGVQFLETVAPIPRTGPSHASILTGLYPIHHGMLRNGTWLSPQIVTIPEVLAGYGYRTAAFVSGYSLKNQACGLASRFQIYDENFSKWRWLPEETLRSRLIRFALLIGRKMGIKPLTWDRPAARTTDAALRWLRSIHGEPFFLWIHYFDPHFPYVPPTPYENLHDPHYKGTVDLRRYSLKWYYLRASQREEVVQDSRALDHIIALYDGEISYVDAQIGRLRMAIDDWQLNTNTLVVLTADHGESLDEHNVYFGHDDLYDTCLKVPLILNFPSNHWAKQRVSDQTRLIDIAPTILDFLNMNAHLPCDGKTLLPLITGQKTEEGMGAAFASLNDEHKVMSCLRHKGFKLIWANQLLRYGHNMIPFREEIYNLSSDPDELQNILAYAPPILPELRRIMAHWSDRKIGDQPELSEEVKERLRSLGYIR
ncbi:MAG: sulfatase [Candidatus Hodarchaeota archaeon]